MNSTRSQIRKATENKIDKDKRNKAKSKEWRERRARESERETEEMSSEKRMAIDGV